ncbi:MAG: FAD-dependent oxidoreductase [Candidatus Diapherotrites archaeon]
MVKIITESKAEIISIKEEAPEFKTFELKSEKEIHYTPGQFVMIWFEDNASVKRAYTISDYSEDKHFLSISVKLVPNGKLTTELFKAKKGDKLIIKGPYGLIKYENEQEVVVIVGGCGISLFFGLYGYFKEKAFPKELALIYSVPTIKEIARKKELIELQEKNKNFRLYFTSPESKGKEKELQKLRCLTEFIDEKFIKEKIPFPENKTYFLCGSARMVKAVTQALTELNVPKKQIKHEKW